MAKPLGACGHPVTKPGVKRCRACWLARGPDGNGSPPIGSICGHPVTRKGQKYCRACWKQSVTTPAVTVSPEHPLEDAIRDALKGSALSPTQIAERIGHGITPGQVLDTILAMQAAGLNVHQFGDTWSLEKRIPVVERTFTYSSRADHTFVFGIASDQHLCSRYAREDALADLYDRFAAAGVDRVFNAGNWIDGEDDKNRFDLTVHGLEPQVAYLAEHYPRRDGITTYAIWGEDHEGWYSRRESIDVGRFAERHMRDAGRDDWIDMGFVEAKADLVNADTGVSAPLVVMHPGGGSSYAYSYRSQKIIESLSGGEKPAVLLIGHYHKLNLNIIRNVWTAQCGTTQDQTVFMRKKGLDAHVGGMIMTLHQDPETGAIYRCVADQLIYYNARYYNDRWSKTQDVVKAPLQLGQIKASS